MVPSRLCCKYIHSTLLKQTHVSWFIYFSKPFSQPTERKTLDTKCAASRVSLFRTSLTTPRQSLFKLSSLNTQTLKVDNYIIMKQNATFLLPCKFVRERTELPTELSHFCLELIIGKIFSHSNHLLHGGNIFNSYWKKPKVNSVQVY